MADDNGLWGFLRPDGSLGMPPAPRKDAQDNSLLRWLRDNGVVQLSGPPSTIRVATDEPVVAMGRPNAMPQMPSGIQEASGDDGADQQDGFALKAAQAAAEDEARQAQTEAFTRALIEQGEARRQAEAQQPSALAQMTQQTRARLEAINGDPAVSNGPQKPVVRSWQDEVLRMRQRPKWRSQSILEQLMKQGL